MHHRSPARAAVYRSALECARGSRESAIAQPCPSHQVLRSLRSTRTSPSSRTMHRHIDGWVLRMAEITPNIRDKAIARRISNLSLYRPCECFHYMRQKDIEVPTADRTSPQVDDRWHYRKVTRKTKSWLNSRLLRLSSRL